MKIAAAIAFTVTFWYLIEFIAFASNFKRSNPELWRSYGCPETFGINGQAAYFSMIWGAKKLPEPIKSVYRARFNRIKALLVIGVLAYIALLFFTWNS